MFTCNSTFALVKSSSIFTNINMYHSDVTLEFYSSLYFVFKKKQKSMCFTRIIEI